ncbi:glycogen/starch synthase [Peptococcaceae bacterium]|nr:glycogen/starch synthase [Peptococcaceae bacterium]
MRILMLSWEYPPNNVGGLAQHVDDLTRFIAQKCEVHVVTVGSSEISLLVRFLFMKGYMALMYIVLFLISYHIPALLIGFCN